MFRLLKNARGQSLIEYVILVALVGCATIGMVRLMQKQVKVNLANAIYAMQGGENHKKAVKETITDDDLRKADFSDFMNGASSQDTK
jgi:Flp pilus assembly pilin Flp